MILTLLQKSLTYGALRCSTDHKWANWLKKLQTVSSSPKSTCCGSCALQEGRVSRFFCPIRTPALIALSLSPEETSRLSSSLAFGIESIYNYRFERSLN